MSLTSWFKFPRAIRSNSVACGVEPSATRSTSAITIVALRTNQALKRAASPEAVSCAAPTAIAVYAASSIRSIEAR